ncbi:MAG: tRNA dihydrouridine(20/20a) synthase DusA [Gammaproteobacteria bacterium]|nr:tRNA dihydrouridine(20/20a) synthase DusA [Gammaproteobacteria bacterium]
MPGLSHRICVAPMMECTDRHQRYFMRLITRYAVLYTEMITVAALLNGDRGRLLRFDRSEHPVALQLGGSDHVNMASCARLGEDFGYDEININVGCPSPRVSAGRFGACLLYEPETIAECVAAMCGAVDIPVTVKTRIGLDRDESATRLYELVGLAGQAGCTTFIVHARNAWLDGLSPKQNRDVPPLRYEAVHALKRDFPQLEIVINGGIRDMRDVRGHLHHCDGAMLGREAYANPYLLIDVDREFYGADGEPQTRAAILRRLLPYVERQIAEGVPLSAITRHILGLYRGRPGARVWRRKVCEGSRVPGAGAATLREIASLVEEWTPPARRVSV